MFAWLLLHFFVLLLLLMLLLFSLFVIELEVVKRSVAGCRRCCCFFVAVLVAGSSHAEHPALLAAPLWAGSLYLEYLLLRRLFLFLYCFLFFSYFCLSCLPFISTCTT